MAKKVMTQIKLQIKAGQANPAPPVGPALGQHGVNIQEFCSAFNERTKEQMGTVTPVVITVFQDRSFSFITKTPPASVLLKKAANLPVRLAGTRQVRRRKGDSRSDQGDRHPEDGGPQRRFRGGGDEDHRRHRAQHRAGGRLSGR